MRICMLIWQYWPLPSGGAESQCRKLVRHLMDQHMDCTVLTARIQAKTPFREKDGNVDVVRVPVMQGLVNAITVFGGVWDKRVKQTLHKPISAVLSSSPATRETFEGRIMRWLNAFSFILGASIWLVLYRSKIDVIHVHIGEWIVGYAAWIGSLLGIPVICKVADMPVFPRLDRSIPFHWVWDKARKQFTPERNYAGSTLFRSIQNRKTQSGFTGMRTVLPESGG